MKLLIHFTLICLLALTTYSCKQKEKGIDIAEIITDKNPEAIKSYLQDLSTSESDYGDFTMTSYFYAGDSIPNLKIIDIPIQNITASYFDNEFVHLSIHINKKENLSKLRDSLITQFGEPKITDEMGDTNYIWITSQTLFSTKPYL
ncbi:hypothetical protein [uncultured Maribacter sp.]|uniref:hypothetical protein n=1 Tax=uncultured Maribacter sp. TaxID=431308 RepID=UPI002622409B|nr:hypothetical protein [uncultured Maribacter sp.]